jgi:transporter family protein
MANVVRTVGSMVFLILATLYMKEFNSTHLTTKNIAYLLLAGIIAGGFAMVVYFKALKLTQASKVVPITSIYPLITVVFSAILLGEDINPKVVIGAILIVLGVMLVSEG